MSDTTIITFGEVMGRLMPPEHLRFLQVMPGSLEFTFGGAEANVAVSLARLGRAVRFVTALPPGPVSAACVEDLRRHGVNTDAIVRDAEGRFGLYFVERGSNQRPSRVVYDRAGSSVSVAEPGIYDWPRIFADARWFHTTGITPAISSTAADASLLALKAARSAGLTTSMDLNYRGKLWRWEPGTEPAALAGRVMREHLPLVDVVIANESDAKDVLGIEAEGSDIDSGRLETGRYPEVARAIIEQFPSVSKVAITLRASVSADHNSWGAMLYDRDTSEATFAPVRDGKFHPWQITDIVDRVGGGDAFGAGLIYALTSEDLLTPQQVLEFASAASCLAHTVLGDFNYTSAAEVRALMESAGTGRVVR